MNSLITPRRKSPPTRRLVFVLLLTLPGVLLYAGRAGAAGGGIDMTFNPHGLGADNSVLRAAVQRDGKVIVGGSFTSYNGDDAAPDRVLRLNADGTLDTTFNYGGAGVNGGVRALALQRDGKVIVGGDFTSYNGDDAAPDRVIRLNADGTLDKSFNYGGEGARSPMVVGYVPTSVLALALQPDGKVIVGGTYIKYNGDTAARSNFMRLNADGTRDMTFNPRGSGVAGLVMALALQPNGKIIVGGRFTAYNIDSYNFDPASPDGVMRLNADGTLDKTFNYGGAGAEGIVGVLALRPDGKIVIGGSFISYNGDKTAPKDVIRLNADGTRDTSFTPGGAGTNNRAFDNVVSALASQPDGKLIVGGAFFKFNGDAAAPHYVLRLNADGTLDTSFNAGGWGAHGYVEALALQPDGKVIIGGYFTSYNRDATAPNKVMRLNADGTRDASFNSRGANRRP